MRYKALSLWQPWASLIALGAKQYETRSWSTNYRGELVIHAAKRFARAEQALCATRPFIDWLVDGDIMSVKDMPLGVCLCVVELVDVVHTEVIAPSLSQQELAFGDYTPGRYAWKLEVVRVFDEPIPARGYQGLWMVEL